MAHVEEWVGDFYIKHTIRCPREDWPRPESEEESVTLDAWRHAFVTRGVEHNFADVASLDLAGDPPRFLSEHLPAIVKLAIEFRRESDSGPKADPMASLDAARIGSRDCPDCGGSGWAVRHVHPEIHGKVRTIGGGAAEVGSSVSYPCSCPLGHHMARGLRQEGQAADPLTVDRYPTLRMAPARWSDRPDNQYRIPLHRWDAESGMPVDGGLFIRDAAELKAFCGSMVDSRESRGDRTPNGERRRAALRSLEARPSPEPGDPTTGTPGPLRGEASQPEPRALDIPEDEAASGWY